MSITVLSMDPGTSSFAASVLKVAYDPDEDHLKLRIVGTTMIENTIRSPADIVLEHRAFKAAVFNLEHNYGPFDLVVAERFQSRGHGGTTIESINMMLGVLATMYPNLTIYTAATWKNSFNRMQQNPKALKDLYLEHKIAVKPTPVKERNTIHGLDCSLMGIYHASQYFDLVPYEIFKQPKRLQAFLKHYVACPKL